MSDLIPQGSADWFAERAGKVTASRVADVIARTKTGWGASRANYMAQLVAERLTGTVAESFTNAAMQWGTDMEPEARADLRVLHERHGRAGQLRQAPDHRRHRGQPGRLRGR
jgi:hypothetical protein